MPVSGRPRSLTWPALLAAALVLGVGSGVGRAALSSPAAIAQSGCEGTDCTIDCLTAGHDWTLDPGMLEWLTVHAKPRLKSTSTPIIWYDPGTDTFPRLRVVGSYKSSGGADLSAEVTVEDDGFCDETDPHDLIRCHAEVAADPDHLCDSWTGDNARIASGSGGGNLVFDRGTDGTTFICQTVENPRPGGNKATDKTVFWDYQP